MKKIEYDKELDKEYLSRPLLDVTFEMSDFFVNIHSEYESFVYIEVAKKLRQEDILSLYSEVVRKCREDNVKIHYTRKFKKRVLESWNLYQESYKNYLNDVNELKNLALKVQKRGIHSGNRDDYVLAELINVRNKLSTYFWGGQAMSTIYSIYNELNDYKRQLDYYFKVHGLGYNDSRISFITL